MPALAKNIVMLALTMVIGVLCSWTAWAFTTSDENRAAPVVCLLVAFVAQVLVTCFIRSDAERIAKKLQDMQLAEMQGKTNVYDAVYDRIAREAGDGNLESCAEWVKVRERIK